MITTNNIGEDSLVCRFVKGCFKLRPQQAKYNCTWDVDVVFDYMENLGSVNEMSLDKLSQKTSILLALALAQRVYTDLVKD